MTSPGSPGRTRRKSVSVSSKRSQRPHNKPRRIGPHGEDQISIDSLIPVSAPTRGDDAPSCPQRMRGERPPPAHRLQSERTWNLPSLPCLPPSLRQAQAGGSCLTPELGPDSLRFSHGTGLYFHRVKRICTKTRPSHGSGAFRRECGFPQP